MTKENYLDLYDFWKNEALNNGFTLKQFLFHVNRFLTEDGKHCYETIAIAAKLAYKALVEDAQMELSLQRVQWS